MLLGGDMMMMMMNLFSANVCVDFVKIMALFCGCCLGHF